MLAKAISANLSRLYCGLFVGIQGVRVEQQSARFIVRDHSGQKLAYVYFEDGPGREQQPTLTLC
jgi:hypothetical protein